MAWCYVPNIRELLANNLTLLLERSNWTQKELARRGDIAEAAIGQYLKGKKAIGTMVLEKMAHAFGVSPAYLLASPEERQRLDSANPSLSEKVLGEVAALEHEELEQVQLMVDALKAQRQRPASRRSKESPK